MSRRRRPSDRLANVENAKSGRPTDMEAIYVDLRSPGSFGGIHNLKRYSGRSEREVKTLLAGRDRYTLHKPRRISFTRRKTYSKSMADLYQIDLADVSILATFNDGARYLLTCIDVITKRAWAVPVRSKTGRDVANAFEKILIELTPNMVQIDKGTEFLNSTFQSMLQRSGKKFYTNEKNNTITAALV